MTKSPLVDLVHLLVSRNLGADTIRDILNHVEQYVDWREGIGRESPSGLARHRAQSAERMRRYRARKAAALALQ